MTDTVIFLRHKGNGQRKINKARTKSRSGTSCFLDAQECSWCALPTSCACLQPQQLTVSQVRAAPRTSHTVLTQGLITHTTLLFAQL